MAVGRFFTLILGMLGVPKKFWELSCDHMIIDYTTHFKYTIQNNIVCSKFYTWQNCTKI